MCFSLSRSRCAIQQKCPPSPSGSHIPFSACLALHSPSNALWCFAPSPFLRPVQPQLTLFARLRLPAGFLLFELRLHPCFGSVLRSRTCCNLPNWPPCSDCQLMFLFCPQVVVCRSGNSLPFAVHNFTPRSARGHLSSASLLPHRILSCPSSTPSARQLKGTCGSFQMHPTAIACLLGFQACCRVHVAHRF
jgi:hypothetical protein